ncbi:hypothetical protein [Streptomyces sp. 4F14]|uniref:hypothetical protein n=1 Tax=Streptomyces sp. 4F14 TaxID=3394380 RepID=UPI003A897BC5
MDLSSGRPAQPDEHPTWDAALALVNRDLDTLLRLWVMPPCDEHRLGMHAREAAGRAVWWCNGGSGHVQGAVGELTAPWQPRR